MGGNDVQLGNKTLFSLSLSSKSFPIYTINFQCLFSDFCPDFPFDFTPFLPNAESFLNSHTPLFSSQLFALISLNRFRLCFVFPASVQLAFSKRLKTWLSLLSEIGCYLVQFVCFLLRLRTFPSFVTDDHSLVSFKCHFSLLTELTELTKYPSFITTQASAELDGYTIITCMMLSCRQLTCIQHGNIREIFPPTFRWFTHVPSKEQRSSVSQRRVWR